MGYFTRSITRRSFATAMAWRVGLFVVLTLGFPFLVYGAVVVTGAKGVGGAAGALALVMGMFLKPLIYLLFCAAMLRPALRRMSSLGMAAALGLAVPVLGLADAGFGIVFGSHWSVGFSLGILQLQAPILLGAALVAILTLAILRDADGDRATERLGLAYRVWVVLLLLLSVHATIAIMEGLLIYATLHFGAGLLKAYASVRMAIQPFLNLAPKGILLGLFSAASIWLVIRDRLNDGPRQAAPSTTGGSGGAQKCFGLNSPNA